MEAVILAAGLGTRLARAMLEPKPAVNIHGIPLLHYPLTSLAIAGVDRIIIVVNEKIKDVVEGLVMSLPTMVRGKIEVELVVNTVPEKGNGYSLLVALPHINESRFIISMADHIYPPRLVRVVYDSVGNVLGGDSCPKYVDVAESTKIHVEGGRVVKVGKNVKPYEFVDVGVHVLEKDLDYLKCSTNEVMELSSLIECLARKYAIKVVDVTGIPWTEIDTYEDYLEITLGSRRAVVDEVLSEWEAVGACTRK